MVTRLLYFIFLVAVTVVCSIVLSPTVADALQGTVSQLNKIILELLSNVASITTQFILIQKYGFSTCIIKL